MPPQGILDLAESKLEQSCLHARYCNFMIERLPSMDNERRKGVKPVPENFEELLNEAQLRTLRSIRRFGWQLHFIRRPLFQEVVPVLISGDGDKCAFLEANGSINEQVNLDIRDCTPASELMKKITG